MTQLVTKVGDVIGDWLLGSKKEFKEKIKMKISDSKRKSGKTVKSTAKITAILDTGKLSKQHDDDSLVRGSSNSDSDRTNIVMNRKVRKCSTNGAVLEDADKNNDNETEDLKTKKDRKETKRKGYFNRRNDLKKEIDIEKGKNRDNDIHKNKDRKRKNSKTSSASKKSSHKNDRDGSPRIIFVCSGE